jgi:WD40 repeat protein
MNCNTFIKVILSSGIALLSVTACTTQKKISDVPSIQPEPARKEIIIEKKTVATDSKTEKPTAVYCRETTSEIFNSSGIRVLPFIKVAFSDMDGDGLSDIIAGTKNGSLQLYKNSGDVKLSHWKAVNGYFEGIRIGAFSAPATGDIDGDGQAEMVIGTGGFSNESGKILFFKNAGSKDMPKWKKIEGQNLKIGDDAAVTVVDYNFDNAPDIIAGNSEGRIFFFKNISSGRNIRFERDSSLSIRQSLDKYVVPAALKVNDRVILVAGTSMGQIYMFEIKRKGGELLPRKINIETSAARFISPSFASLLEKDRFDLVLADGDGNLSYYVNKKNDFTAWEKHFGIFNDRLFAGPACAPTVSYSENGMCMIVGTIDGNLKFYEFNDRDEGLPWVEKRQYLKGIKLSGFSRGVLTSWEGREMLITGESNGEIKAFMNSGTRDNPRWKEEKKFFRGVRAKHHSTPTVFDLNEDGKWELVTGDEDGKIYAYQVKGRENGLPQWEKITGVFDQVRVQGFSTPAFVRYQNTLYLFVGQENGFIKTFAAVTDDASGSAYRMVFREKDILREINMQNHSSPFAVLKRDMFELISGDYDGNIRHFLCEGG